MACSPSLQLALLLGSLSIIAVALHSSAASDKYSADSVRTLPKNGEADKDGVMGEAERLIRALNLIPNVHLPPPDSSILIEHPFRLPGLLSISDEDLGHHAGYFPIKGTHASRMFYLFFESRGDKKKDPVVLWMSGGPGCSSELALFYENGPFKITNDLTLQWNENGWDKASSIIFVDQPIGTGFSYSTDVRDIRHDEKGVSEDMYQFLQAFFQAHSEFAQNEFFVTGESYAGHYVPAVTSRIHEGNKAKEGLAINLKGFAIGNGLTNPEIQYAAYADFALQMGLIEETDYQNISGMYPACKQAIKKCGDSGTVTCATAYMECNAIFNGIMSIIGDVNITTTS